MHPFFFFFFSECGARLLTAIRAALVKGRGGEDAVHAAAEEATAELKEQICLLHRLQQRAADGSGSGISPARVTRDLRSARQAAALFAGGWNPNPNPLNTF